jgi:predicted ester cyclase
MTRARTTHAQMDALIDAHNPVPSAEGRPFGIEGRGRPVRVRLLHVFEFAGGLISRESAWPDMGAVRHQLSAA